MDAHVPPDKPGRTSGWPDPQPQHHRHRPSPLQRHLDSRETPCASRAVVSYGDLVHLDICAPGDRGRLWTKGSTSSVLMPSGTTWKDVAVGPAGSNISNISALRSSAVLVTGYWCCLRSDRSSRCRTATSTTSGHKSAVDIPVGGAFTFTVPAGTYSLVGRPPRACPSSQSAPPADCEVTEHVRGLRGRILEVRDP